MARKRGMQLALAGASLLGAIAVFELALRVLPDRWTDLPGAPAYPGEHANRESEHFVPDPDLGWRMRPDHAFDYEIEGGSDLYLGDAAGFRIDPAGTGVVVDDGFEIVIAGDSFTYGTGVAYRETFGAQLQRALVSTRVRNLGMPGFGIDQIWMSVRHYGLSADPDLVVFAFIDGDFERSLSAYRRSEGLNKPAFLVEDGRLRRQRPSDRPRAAWRFIEELRLSQLHARAMRLVGRHWPLGTWWHRNAAILSAVREDCAAAGVPILFVRLPSRGGRAFPVLARFLAERDADYLDLGNAFPSGIHFARDSHIDDRGHHWVAEQIASWITGAFELPNGNRRERPPTPR